MTEKQYYVGISEYIQEQLTSLLRSFPRELYVFHKVGSIRLDKGLIELVKEHEECHCINEYAKTAPPIELDIIFVVTDTIKFKIIIIEVKENNSMGLMECSQLVGYCIVSSTNYGLLINVNGKISKHLRELTSITHIEQLSNGETILHDIGFMEWNSSTKNIQYIQGSSIKSFDDLCNRILTDFSK